MNTPFSRSIRVLDADKFRPSLLVIGLSVAVLVAWLIWFFFATITLLEEGNIGEISGVGVVTAQFAGDSSARLKVGQQGWLRLNGEAGDSLGLVPVIVINRSVLNKDKVEINAQILDEAFFYADLSGDGGGPTGRIQIEVEQVSPARLLLRSSGQFANAPAVSVSPQQ